jgi:hypothetical protein
LLAFVMNMIPYIGSIIAGVITILIALVYNGVQNALATFLVVIMINIVLGNYLTPKNPWAHPGDTPGDNHSGHTVLQLPLGPCRHVCRCAFGGLAQAAAERSPDFDKEAGVASAAGARL